ncbi:MAG: GNAT family N-acetyltransferase, partial [Acidimicrobiia bacterium]
MRKLQQDENIMRYMGGARDESGVVAWLGRQVAHWEQHGFGAWLLRQPPNTGAMGTCGLRYT